MRSLTERQHQQYQEQSNQHRPQPYLHSQQCGALPQHKKRSVHDIASDLLIYPATSSSAARYTGMVFLWLTVR